MRGTCALVIAAWSMGFASLSSGAQAQALGDKCRGGDIAACRTLCSRGFDKACARAKGGGGNMVSFGEKSAAELHQRGLLPSGLVPVLPKDARCPPVASGFADTTRYDGSKRATRANFGMHDGLDISLPIGTPVIAILSGTVIHKRSGPLLVGNEIVIRHSPGDTGFKVWTFAKYKHFDKLPSLKAGDKVAMGDLIAPSGRTGTVGGQYGKNGYPHLHVSGYWNEDGAYTIERDRVDIKRPHYVDPLAFFFRRELDTKAIRAIPAEDRKISIPYKSDTGRIVPAGARAVWPVVCRSR